MNSERLLPFFILGPTAVGKSAIAAGIAGCCAAEIISADAFQIYEGLDLLTAKPDAVTLSHTPHHLIGEIPLSEECDAARFSDLARERIAAVQARGRLPIVVGGTGFYVRALTHGLPEIPQTNPALRQELERTPLPELLARLAGHDPECIGQIDRANPRRVIRAIEVCLLTGKPFSSFREQTALPRFPLRGVILTCERGALVKRIADRTREMWSAGVVQEVKSVIESMRPISRTARQAIGFDAIQRHLAGEMGVPECIGAIETGTRQYAKRQLTWFRRESAFSQIDRMDAPQVIRRMIESDGG